MTAAVIEDGLYSYLSGQATISSVVEDRIYPSLLPQKPILPAIVYYNIGTNQVEKQNARSTLEVSRFQIDCYAREAREAKLLDKVVKNVLLLDSYQGVSFGLFAIRAVYGLQLGIDDFDDVPDDFRVTSEYEIWHSVVV